MTLVTISSQYGFAGNSEYLYSTISLSEGLTHPTVKSILRDSKDYLWIGTKSGLNKVDKANIITYKHNPVLNNSLPDNDIIDIFEDDKENIWIICSTGVSLYDRKNDNFKAITHEGNTVKARGHLLAPNGVYLGGAGTIFFFNYSDGTISTIPSKGGSDKYYTAIYPWGRDRFLLATRWDGLWVFNTRTGEIDPYTAFEGKRIVASLLDSDNEIWISEYGNGLNHIDRKGKVSVVKGKDLNENEIILDIIEAGGRLLLATDGNGIIEYNKTTGETKRIDSEEGSPSQLRSINRLYFDDYNHIYAGTVRGGLVYMQPTPFKTIRPGSDYEAITVSTLVADENSIWVGIDGNGIMLFEPENNRVTPMEDTRDLKIVSLENFDDHRLLVSVYDNGIFLFDKRDRKLKEAPEWLQKISNENKSKGIPIDLLRLPGDRIAVVTDKLYISDTDGNRVDILETEGTPKRLRFFYSDIGTLLCYSEEGVYNVDLDENTMTPLFKVSGENIECAAYDGDRFIYAGTTSGVKRYDFETGNLTLAESRSRMPLGSGLTSLTVNDDKLWIGALGQLFVIDLTKGGIRRFGASDGVSPNEFIYKAVLTTPQYMLFGGVNGLLKVNTKDLDNYAASVTRLPLKLEEVFADGMPVNMEGKEARLPDNYSTIKLRFTGGTTDPVKTEPVRIYIGHKNLNSVIETYDNTLTLGHLQASSGGRYDVYASMRDIDGIWTEPNHVGAILVPVAWWRKPFAIIIICILVALALALTLVYLWSRRKHLIRNRLEEQKRESLEKEVGFLMNLNYDLRTPLTLIYSRLKLLTDNLSKGKIQEKKVVEELDNIYRNTGEMRDIINTTVDLWRSGDMKAGEVVENINVASWLKEMLIELKNNINDKKIIIDTEGVNESIMILCDLRRATIAMLNVLRSTISHAEEKTELTINANEDEANMTISISFYNDESHGAGEELKYADHLMALMDGDLKYNRYGKGVPSVIVVRFPRELKRSVSLETNPVITENNNEIAAADNLENENEESISMLNLSNLTVIVVEEDEELCDLLVKSLGNLFGKVLYASNGKDALTFIKNSNPDLIITEARLQGMSGTELCKTIKKTKEYSHIPVIMLTTRLEELSIANGNNFGADNYLTKPFDIGVLEKRCISVLKSFDRVKQWYRSQASDILPTDRSQSNEAEAFVLKVKKIVEQSISKPGFGVDDIVNQMLVSRSTLYGKFKEFTGQSLGNYINDYKLNKAKEMLATTNMTMVDISDALGFTTQRYFSTFFKERTGMTPTAYRNNNQQTKHI